MYSERKRIERLEQRIAPATFLVTNLAASGAGSLADAVDKANAHPGADIISIQKGGTIVTSATLSITSPVKIQSIAKTPVVISGHNDHGVFNIAANAGPVSLISLKITGGKSSDDGGGVLSKSTLVVTKCIITGNHSSGLGGGIAQEAGSLTISGSTINSNSADSDGGGILVTKDAVKVTISGSIINANKSSKDGGGISTAVPITLTTSALSNNKATILGGGIAIHGRNATITSTKIIGNSAIKGGGGILEEKAHLGLISSSVSSNVAGDSGHVGAGGGILLALAPATISKSQITKNKAVDQVGGSSSGSSSGSKGLGGGIYAGAGSSSGSSSGGAAVKVNVTGSTISGNIAHGGGGGVYYVAPPFSLSVVSSVISGNTMHNIDKFVSNNGSSGSSGASS